MKNKPTCEYCNSVINIEKRNEDTFLICADCLSLDTAELIFNHCLYTDSKNPYELANKLMKFPNFNMHCPEHHFLVPAVLLTTYFNTKGRPANFKKLLITCRNRANLVPGAFCGTHGSCGAAVGTGIFISLITGALPLSTSEWELANLMTSLSLKSMSALGGPRCCKRVTFISIQEAVGFLKEKMDFDLSSTEKIICEYSSNNKECMEERCPFFPQ